MGSGKDEGERVSHPTLKEITNGSGFKLRQNFHLDARVRWLLACVLAALAASLWTYERATASPAPTTTPPTTAASAAGQPDIVWSGSYPASVSSVAYAPDGQTIFTGNTRTSNGHPGNLWRASDGTLLRTVFFNEIGCGEINRVAYSPDGQIMATISGCSTRLWRVSDGTLIRKISSGGGGNANTDPSSLAFSPDGQLLATTFSSGYNTGIVKLWSVADGTLIRSMSAHGYNTVRFSPDGQIVTAVGKRGLDMWRVADGSLIRHIDGVTRALAFSPDGQMFATAGLAGGEFSDDDTIEFYRVSDGTLLRQLKWTGGVNVVAFTPDGQALVSVGWESNQAQDSTYSVPANGTIRFWRVSDGALLKTYDQATGVSVNDVAVSPDGKFFAYTNDTTVTLARVPDYSASACTFSINPRHSVIPCEGGGDVIEVTASSGSCSWKAASRVNWITITSGAGGTGDGYVHISVEQNGCPAVAGSNLMSEGLLVVGEQTAVVNQMLSPQGTTPTPTPTATPTPTPTPTPTLAGLQYYPLAHPFRLLDTRQGQPACYAPGAPVNADTSRTQTAAGACEGLSIPSTAKAVVGNAAAVNDSGASAGYLTLYPSGVQRPVASSVNYAPGDIVSNGFTVGLGSDGAFQIYASSTLNVVVDVTGYYAPPGQGGLYYHPLPHPFRLLDTRAGQPACDAPGSPVQANVSRVETARTTCGGVVLPDDAQAVVGNAAVVNTSQGAGAGFVTLYPSGAQRPSTSNVNYAPGQIVSNAFTVGLGSGGAFDVYASTTLDIVVDVTGYYSASAPTDANGVSGLLFYTLAAPMRLLDTRPGLPACVNTGSPLAGDNARAQNARMTCGGLTVPDSALAIVGNAAVVNSRNGAGAGYLTVYPTGLARPVASNVNYTPGQIVSNTYTVGLGSDGAFNIYALSTLDFVTDISGYFAP